MLNDTSLTQLIQRAGMMQDYALELGDTVLFFKYHKITLRLIQCRINLITKR